jgi:hypothetical protein
MLGRLQLVEACSRASGAVDIVHNVESKAQARVHRLLDSMADVSEATTTSTLEPRSERE